QCCRFVRIFHNARNRSNPRLPQLRKSNVIFTFAVPDDDLDRGAPKFLFHADRIDQIAASTAVACTDRSTSRWKQNQRVKKQEEAFQRKLQPRLTNLMS